MSDSEESCFWNSFLRAVETEPKDVRTIRGSSGLEHSITALGVDEKRRRVVVVSGEGDARTTAIASSDIQAAMPSLKVVMARPIAVNLSPLARIWADAIGSMEIKEEDMDWFGSNEAKGRLEKLAEEYEGDNKVRVFNPEGSVDYLTAIKEVIQQLSLVEVEWQDEDDFSLDIKKLAVLDPVEADRKYGVCSIPLYNFQEDDMEVFKRGQDFAQIQALLIENDIRQYFFPPIDQTALGIVDRSTLDPSEIVDQVSQAPAIGHPFGENEIIDSHLDFRDVIDELRARGLAVEGELGMEVTEEGKSIRANVKYKPREGFLSRLSNVVSFHAELNFKDLFGMG